MAFVEDFGAFLSVDEMATAAQLDGLPVVGIFDRTYREPFDGMASSSPRFVLPTSACIAIAPGSRLVVGGEVFGVRSVEPDGTGITELRLERLS